MGICFCKRNLKFSGWYNGKDEDAAQIKAEQERLEERLLKGYEVISVKAEVDGFCIGVLAYEEAHFGVLKR